MFVCRSEFLAAACASALFQKLSGFITPRPNLDKLDFSRCWEWSGAVNKGGRYKARRFRTNVHMGEYSETVLKTQAAVPIVHLPSLGTMNARRLVYELFNPETGTRQYILRGEGCTNPLCVNPHHWTPQFQETTKDRAKWPDYLPRDHVFHAHRVGSWHPARDYPVNTVSSAETPSPATGVAPPAFTPPKKPPYGNGAGWTTDDPYQFFEQTKFKEMTGIEVELAAVDVKREWQDTIKVFISNCSPAIRWWLDKWPPVVPKYHLINGLGTEDLDSDLANLKSMGNPPPWDLSAILEKCHYWIHPRIVLDWYKALPDERKAEINLLN